MAITATIIKDSLNSSGNRITTFVVKANRYILAEINTHRALSKSTSSSRAIPFNKLVEGIKNDPARPVHWGKNQAGMQANEELLGEERDAAMAQWDAAMYSAIAQAEQLHALGVSKQIVNRVIENYGYSTIILTGTDFENFFALRAHEDAQPEFQDLAFKMLEAYNSSTPTRLQDGEWHIPFGDRYGDDLSQEDLLKVATARCARVSYLTFDGEANHAKDLELYDRLFKSGHFSAFEHCAQALATSRRVGNFQGWCQLRKQLPGETRQDPRVKTYSANH